MKDKNGRRDVVEGFRVLTLLYRVDEIPSEQRERLVELFKRYRAIASLYFWSKRLGLEEGVKEALERAKEEVPYYWRKALDEGSPLYAFDVEEMKRPRKQVLKLPLTEALQLRQRNESPKTGAHIDERGKLVIYLGDRESLELPIPERALRWLKEKEDEVAPLKVHKTVRIQWCPERAQTLKVQIVFRVERPKPPRPDPKEALLCYVDVNSAYGIAVVIAAYDGERIKVFETLKFRPPNQGRRLREAAKKMRAAVYGSKPNVNYALARLSMKFDASGWVKAAAAEIFKKAMKYAKSRSILMNFDIPKSETVKNSRLQRTLSSIKSVAANLANWYGMHVEFRCYSSRKCPLCGGELEEFKTKRTRIMRCSCGFSDERDYVPFYWWLRTLNLPPPKRPISSAVLVQEGQDPEA